VLQANAYDGYNGLYRKDRNPGPVPSALCWAHSHQNFFELAHIAGNVSNGKPAYLVSPLGLEAVNRIDAIFKVESEINGLNADAPLAACQNLCHLLVNSLHDWLQEQHTKPSRHDGGPK